MVCRDLLLKRDLAEDARAARSCRLREISRFVIESQPGKQSEGGSLNYLRIPAVFRGRRNRDVRFQLA
jgi:hypothetical protein